MTNIIESGLNSVTPLGHGVCKYLWTLPMFHCAGWTFPWSVTAVGGVHVCLRKIDYGEIWRYLIEEGVTHFNAGTLPATASQTKTNN
jgi:acyl-CoA synthetase (AMP-forming)/AMP-acid ligase II